MSPVTLTPLPNSVPFDDLVVGDYYFVELRPWAATHTCVCAAFVSLNTRRGDPLGIVMQIPGGQFITFWRTQILKISRG